MVVFFSPGQHPEMIIARRAKVTDMAVICLVADGIFNKHPGIASLQRCSEAGLAWSVGGDILTSEREKLVRELVASLGAGVKVGWNSRLELIEVSPKEFTSPRTKETAE